MAITEEQIRQLNCSIEDLASQVQEFRDQYDLDMRGDTKINGGNKGLVHGFLELRKIVEDYPSVTWLFAHKPGRTVAVVLSSFIVLMALWSAGIITLVAKVFGVSLP